MSASSDEKIIITDEFEGLILSMTDDVKRYKTARIPKDRIIDTFRCLDKLPFDNLDISFSDNEWDFAPIISYPTSRPVKFVFNENSIYSDILKMFVLDSIIKHKCKIVSLTSKYTTIRIFLEDAEKDGFQEVSSIPKYKYNNFLEENRAYLTNKNYKHYLFSFVKFYETNFAKLNDPSVIEYLKDHDLSKVRSIRENNKTPEIPSEYLSNFINVCKDIMYNENEPKNDRIIAASLILYSQTGMRTGEFFTIKTNAIDEVPSPSGEEPLRYLNFLTYKNAGTDNGTINAHSYINNLSYDAYKILDEICRPYREKIGSDYLYVTSLQKKPYGNDNAFFTAYRRFVLRHAKKLKSLNINGDNSLSDIQVKKLNKVHKNGTLEINLDLPCYDGITEDDYISYPQIRQFRVSVCTNLYRQGVPIHYIRKHMNHLSEEMSAYYIRPTQTLDQDYSETIYSAVFKDGSKMLGRNSDAFMQKVNEFIESADINIKNNVDEVIKLAANRFPLRNKVGGMCIRCGEIIPCASNNSTDEIYCAFGMCPNHCHMFFMADISYDEYCRHKEIIEYNKDNGFRKAAQKETNKIKYVVEQSLVPELDELKNEINRRGKETIIEEYPQLTEIINDFDRIYEEACLWIQEKQS